ncbi:MAG: MBOAT family O-acyltransferase [Paludibacteraceae bacterium]|nr:MBOAT family O-acyltransferase [Paludibacteraceae bacterium]
MNILEHIFAFNSDSPLLFTQFYFWAFFALVYALFALIMNGTKTADSTRRMHMRNVYLMFVSWFFYYKTSGLFLIILAFITLSDWLIAQRIAQNTAPKRRLSWLCLSIAIDLGLLVYFKYAYFFTSMVNDLFGSQFEVFDLFAYIGNGFSQSGRFDVDKIILPVGISFYIFQVISYTTDVYRERIRPVRNILDFGFYVSFFPQLVAGPIVRAEEFIPQLYKPFRLSRRLFGLSVFWILNGLAKKIILSDYLAVNLIDRVFDNPLLFSGFENLFALFAYSLQVYADFSGYTDIAIGVAMLMGFYLPMNFDSPYKSQNPQEFWRRWHMSLGRWLKSYLYIPLGGNRRIGFGTFFWLTVIGIVCTVLTGTWWVVGIMAVITLIIIIVSRYRPLQRKLLYSNLNSFITQVLGGLWHGASWNFTIWGGINGIGMIVNKFWREMGWHMRMACMALLTASLWIINHHYPLPVWLLFAVWASIVCAGTTIRYVYWLCTRCITIHRTWKKITDGIATAWAIAQTFTFITFTRLFFRSSSNLDPATANEVAWSTAKNMVNQMGGAWNNAIIPEFLYEYRWVVAMFVMGMLIHWLPTRWKRRYRLYFAAMPLWLMVVIVMICIVVIYQFVTADTQPFIYFQF